MIVHLHCWLLSVSKPLMRNTFVSSVRLLSEEFNQGLKTHPCCWQHHSMGHNIRLNKPWRKMENVTWYQHSFLSTSSVARLCCVARYPSFMLPCIPCHDGLHTPKTWTRVNTCYGNFLVMKSFLTAMRKII